MNEAKIRDLEIKCDSILDRILEAEEFSQYFPNEVRVAIGVQLTGMRIHVHQVRYICEETRKKGL